MAADRLLAITLVQNHLRGAFDEQYLATGGVVKRRHEFVLRFERYGVDSWKCSLFSLQAQTKLHRERQERPFCRIALHLPETFLLEQLCVVAKQRDAPHEREDWFLFDRSSILLDLALRRIAITPDLIRRLGGDGGHDHHFHERQSAGLVRAYSRYRAQGFDRGQPSDDGVAPGHALYSDCHGDCDQGGQPFRDGRYRDADDRLEEAHKVHALYPFAISKDQNTDYSDDQRDDVTKLLDLAQEGRFQRAHAGQQLVDAAEFRLVTSRDDHTSRPARNHHRAGKGHALAIADRCIRGHRIDCLFRRY